MTKSERASRADKQITFLQISSSGEIKGGINWEFVCWKSKFPAWIGCFD